MTGENNADCHFSVVKFNIMFNYIRRCIMKRFRMIAFWSVVAFSAMAGLSGSAQAAGICIKDELGEEIHLTVHPGGLLTGHSEFMGAVTGTAIGSFKVLSDQEVMLGGDVNNDPNSDLYPGKFHARINVVTMTGSTDGFLFLDDGTLYPFHSALFPCGTVHGQPANWGAFFEK